MCSKLTPRAPIPDSRIAQFMQPCTHTEWKQDQLMIYQEKYSSQKLQKYWNRDNFDPSIYQNWLKNLLLRIKWRQFYKKRKLYAKFLSKWCILLNPKKATTSISPIFFTLIRQLFYTDISGTFSRSVHQSLTQNVNSPYKHSCTSLPQ